MCRHDVYSPTDIHLLVCGLLTAPEYIKRSIHFQYLFTIISGVVTGQEVQQVFDVD